MAGGINTFGYAYQNSIKYIDPDGRIVPALVWGAAAYLGGALLEALVLEFNQDTMPNGSLQSVGGIPLATGLIGWKATSLRQVCPSPRPNKDILVLGRGPQSRLKKLALQEGGQTSTTQGVGKAIFKKNYRDIRSADEIIQCIDNIPETLEEALKIGGGQFSRAEVFMINQRKDLLAKTVRKRENP